jgi:hypothetical protein
MKKKYSFSGWYGKNGDESSAAPDKNKINEFEVFNPFYTFYEEITMEIKDQENWWDFWAI